MFFRTFELRQGSLYSDLGRSLPSVLGSHVEGTTVVADDSLHTFGFVLSGNAALEAKGGGPYPLSPRQYFSAPGKFQLHGSAQVVLFHRLGYRGLFFLGGPTENTGRLTYIDHSRTTLICPPPRDGDPCLNLLTFPPSIFQSAHTHPSLRLGAVLRGSGKCVLGDGTKAELAPGMAFVIGDGLVHSFESGAEGLDVIAFHPDSEGGPRDEYHPMLNRTYLVRPEEFSQVSPGPLPTLSASRGRPLL